MAYCSLQDLRDLLPKNITIGDNVVPTVTSARASTIGTSVANKFIYFATQFIDSRLSQLYVIPLRRIKKVSIDLIANMMPSSTDVMVDDISGFYVGCAIKLEDDNGTENATVSLISENVSESGVLVRNFNHLTLSAGTQNAYDAGSHGIVHLLVYPDPVPVMTARMACSLMFDKIFVADQEPDVSNYGKTLRNMSTIDINAILAGQVRLTGQEFMSRRFVRSQLFDAVRLAVDSVTIDQGKEGA